MVENYEANLTASLNVNLREALAVTPLAQEKYNNTEVLLNVPYTLVPIERFDEDNVEDIYRLNFHETATTAYSMMWRELWEWCSFTGRTRPSAGW